MQIPVLSTPASIAFGVFLIVLGGSFAWKGYQALIKGRLLIWQGWLPFTLVSPFVNHLPPGKNSLLKYKEAMWIHVVMGPTFLVLCVLCIAAGIDYIGFPGTEYINTAMTGGKLGVAPAITFSKQTGYTFPILPRAAAHFGKLMGGKIGIKAKDSLYDSNGQSDEDRQKSAGY